MAKWSGKIGFYKEVETSPGVWDEEITEHKYCGEAIQVTRRTRSADKVNDDIEISNKISIVADAYARENLYSIRYAEFMGAMWKVTEVSPQHPRLSLTLGGLYNGKQA